MILKPYEVCKYEGCPYKTIGGVICHGMKKDRNSEFSCSVVNSKGEFIELKNFYKPKGT
jgi:hypothetical protein